MNDHSIGKVTMVCSIVTAVCSVICSASLFWLATRGPKLNVRFGDEPQLTGGPAANADHLTIENF